MVKINQSQIIDFQFYSKLALVRKRQTPVQSLTKDERIAMTEREI